MISQSPSEARARVIVVANEKGGTGKSTVAMHLAIATMKAGKSVGTIDLDSRQKTFTHYIENRHAWAQQISRNLEIPSHSYFVESAEYPTEEDEAADGRAMADKVSELSSLHNVVIIDTPGRYSYMGRLAHSLADVLITPLNDSFVDLDVLSTIDPDTMVVSRPSYYSQMVEDVRKKRESEGGGPIDWVVLRNRLSMLGSRNTRCVGEALQRLAQKLNFRLVEGVAERVIFREFYQRGLTAIDTLDEVTLGARTTLSHVSAGLEIQNLLVAVGLQSGFSGDNIAHQNRDAA